MPVNAQGIWLPDLFGKQWDVFNSYDRALLVSGSRYAAKSYSILHRLVRHMWEVPNSRVGIFSRVLKNSKDAGLWKNLHEITLKEWIASGIGIKYTTKDYNDKPGPKVDGTTRTPFFRLRNMYGGESECMLFSLSNDNEAEATLKEREFSLIYFSELSNFSTRSVLSLGRACLRLKGISYDQQQWMADTNPAEEGEHSWIYEAWYIEPTISYDDYVQRQQKLHKYVPSEEEFTEQREGMRLIEMHAKDNIKLDKRQISELRHMYSYDPALAARFRDGLWVFGGGDESHHFRRFFKPNIHVLGSCEGPDEDNWEMINPSPACHALITGHDLGETNNHASCIIEKQMASLPTADPKVSLIRAHFSVLDELVSIKEFVNLDDFTLEFMRMIEALEKSAGRTFNLDMAYSDSSTLSKWNAASSSFPAEQVEAASNGRLVLIGVNKSQFPPRWRVQILQQLLAFNRLRVSAHCVHTIQMLKDLRKGSGKLNFVLQSDSNRHIFDALTYALISELREEIVTASNQNVATRSHLAVSIK